MFRSNPTIIQGGMGVAISTWRLARAVSRTGQLGVVSGTALDGIFARRLQDGDPGGDMRRALNSFPLREMTQRILEMYFIPGGKAANQSYKMLPMHFPNGPREMQELCIVSNFVEIFLAKEGHDGIVGMNYLEKIQLPLLPSIYGAMLAGVDYVLMGAGIPLKLPGVLDRLAQQEVVTYSDEVGLRFDPHEYSEGDLQPLTRPKFLAVIASNTLALTMVKKANGRVDGFVVEGPTAGGHNAPPRGKPLFNDAGEPVYGDRDRVDLPKLIELGLPFWLAGGYGTPEKVREALDAGAAGVQVGTVFAFCEESGLTEPYRHTVLEQIATGTTSVYTDPLASPTGFPFKVVRIPGSNSEPEVYSARPRICDLGYLREAYRTPEGKIDFRCAGEPLTIYLAKGGKAEDTIGRKCLCNGLMADAGYPQVRHGRVEQGLVTAGDDLAAITPFLPSEGLRYSAASVVSRLLG